MQEEVAVRWMEGRRGALLASWLWWWVVLDVDVDGPRFFWRGRETRGRLRRLQVSPLRELPLAHLALLFLLEPSQKSHIPFHRNSTFLIYLPCVRCHMLISVFKLHFLLAGRQDQLHLARVQPLLTFSTPIRAARTRPSLQLAADF